MSKKIITIEFNIPGYAECFYSYSSDQSLLDADIIIFESRFNDYDFDSNHQGKPSYDENESFRLQEATRHWKRELSTALEEGKTIFVFFSKYEEIFIRTGEKNFVGSGRNARVNTYVTPYDNYQFFPIDLPPLISKGGNKLLFNNNQTFSTFWKEFNNFLKYESYIDGKIKTPLFFTKTADKPVGGIFRVGKGHLVLLPPLRYPEDKFTKYDEKEEEEFWTKEAIKFGKRLVQVLVDIDKALRSLAEVTPPPQWALAKEFEIPEVNRIKKKISSITKKIDSLIVIKNELLQRLIKEKELKNLLFEKGKPLENTILLALHILGYKAERYDNGELELDSVILSPEGDRFIGEAEGKDDAPINIDKFRQLESNIQEDLEREDIKAPAIGILFGNGFRLTTLKKRPEQFTDKCIKNAARLNAILIKTPDLFKVSEYLKTSEDKSFAKKCRQSIVSSRGKIVNFPIIPTKKRISGKKRNVK